MLPEVGVGGVAQEVGDSAGVDVGVLLDLARELRLVVEPRARQEAPPLVELAPVPLQHRSCMHACGQIRHRHVACMRMREEKGHLTSHCVTVCSACARRQVRRFHCDGILPYTHVQRNVPCRLVLTSMRAVSLVLSSGDRQQVAEYYSCIS